MHKLFYLSLFLFAALPVCAQKKTIPNTTTINVLISDLRMSGRFIVLDTVSFYKLPEDTLAFSILPDRYNRYRREIKDIPVATYRVTYKNLYHQCKASQVVLKDQPENDVVLCADSLDAYPNNTLAMLKEGGRIVINYLSQGCFHHSGTRIVITRKKGQFEARYYDLTGEKATKLQHTYAKYNKSSFPTRVILTDKNIGDFIRFENELLLAKDDGCTTTDWYELKTPLGTIKRTDGSCTWNGFSFLSNSFFPRTTKKRITS